MKNTNMCISWTGRLTLKLPSFFLKAFRLYCGHPLDMFFNSPLSIYTNILRRIGIAKSCSGKESGECCCQLVRLLMILVHVLCYWWRWCCCRFLIVSMLGLITALLLAPSVYSLLFAAGIGPVGIVLLFNHLVSECHIAQYLSLLRWMTEKNPEQCSFMKSRKKAVVMFLRRPCMISLQSSMQGLLRTQRSHCKFLWISSASTVQVVKCASTECQ